MTSLRTAKRFVFPLLGLWVLLYASFSVFTPPLLDGSDALTAVIAREMVIGGHWIIPWANGIRYAQRPPLLYWAVAVSFGIFDVSDWAARIPLALGTLALFIATFSFGRRLFHSPAAAFYAALTLLTSCGVFLFGHLLLRDVFLCLWLTLALNFFWRSLHQEKHVLESTIGFAVCCALGVLTRGFAGVLLPLAIASLYLLFTGKLRYFARWQIVPAVLAFLAVVLPWHIAVDRASVREAMVSLLPPMAGGRVPLLIFWLLPLLWIAPWSIFSLRALRIGAASPDPDRRGQARLLCVLWILAVLVFFSFAARQEFNLVSALPPMALLAGGWLAEDESLPHHQGRIAAWILFFLGMAAAAVVAYLLIVAPRPAPGADIATLLRPNSGHHAVFFGFLFDLTRSAIGAFKVPLWIALFSLLVGVSACLWYRLRDNARMANCFLAGMIVAILIAAHLALNIFSPVLSSAILAEAIKPEVRPSEPVVVNGPFENASSFAFYLERSVLLLNPPATSNAAPPPAPCTSAGQVKTEVTVKATMGPPPTPTFLIDNAALCGLWQSQQRVWLWTTPQTLPTLPGDIYVIGRSGGKEVVSNQPNVGGASF
jgi:4-amino-4-deoxy-L-arabinose transferase-like glycosyltransferase